MSDPKEPIERRVTIEVKHRQVVTVYAHNAASAKRIARDPRSWMSAGTPMRLDETIRAASAKGNGGPA